jgi:4-hydroxy-2-oxoheptanedioate aldolase
VNARNGSVANLLRRPIAGGEPLLCAWSTLGSAFAAEVVGRSGADLVVVDVEHGLVGWDGAIPIVVTLSAARIPVLVRVSSHEPIEIMKALDAGAAGVVVPHVESAQQAAAAAAACRYPPEGRRSWGPTRASLLDQGDTFAANRSVVCIAMLETATAVARVDEIVATPGIDAVIVGSNDLALDLLEADGSVAAVRESQEFERRLAAVASACSDAGIVAGAPILPSFSAERLDVLGFGLIVGASDAALLRSAAAREFVGSPNRLNRAATR